MQYRYSTVFGALSLASHALAAYIPSEPWSTLTPEAKPAGTTDYSGTFGIEILPITSTSSLKAKRDVVTQIGDGQIQATTSTAPKSTPKTSTAAAVVTQIGDGQIQATTSTAAAVVTQIGDGQIQATTSTAAAVVTQIGDGQIQATTFPESTSTSTADAIVSQITDGQIQATTATSSGEITTHITETLTATKTLSSGSQQQTTLVTSLHTETKTLSENAAQLSDGQVQHTSASQSAYPAASSSSKSNSPSVEVACYSREALSMTLSGGILLDGSGRVGSIVANRQFQFDGPPPQAGAIYAAGWSVTHDGKLAIGNTTTFYQCLSGNFYNLYDETLGEHCQPVYLNIVDLIKC
ncbi:unnamed protein product [Ambrosiozyma monospora]|uniref:Unnamed protein product n=1 Tax=Ambrosiozyma monospora TaxID=43982 RepID=A0ACB5SXI6_AMBMO|nr:unnamed protein product [Ambrosiozyma monospora]